MYLDRLTENCHSSLKWKVNSGANDFTTIGRSLLRIPRLGPNHGPVNPEGMEIDFSGAPIALVPSWNDDSNNLSHRIRLTRYTTASGSVP